MSESLEQSREAALSSFQDKIAVLVEKHRAIDGTIVKVTNVRELTADEAGVWEVYKHILETIIKPNADYAQLLKQCSVLDKEWRAVYKTVITNKQNSRAGFYDWLLNRLMVFICNLPILVDRNPKYFDEIIGDMKEQYVEYFGS